MERAQKKTRLQEMVADFATSPESVSSFGTGIRERPEVGGFGTSPT